MWWEGLFFEPIKVFQSNAIQKSNKNKKLNKRRVLLNLKKSKNRGICKHYNKKLFVSNYFSKWSEVYLKINFIISDMKVYLVKFFLLNIHKATRLLDLDKAQHH